VYAKLTQNATVTYFSSTFLTLKTPTEKVACPSDTLKVRLLVSYRYSQTNRLGETVVFNFDSHSENWPMAWTTSRGAQLLPYLTGSTEKPPDPPTSPWAAPHPLGLSCPACPCLLPVRRSPITRKSKVQAHGNSNQCHCSGISKLRLDKAPPFFVSTKPKQASYIHWVRKEQTFGIAVAMSLGD